MAAEVVENLHINKTRKYIDATVGSGGHTLEILKKGGQVLGIELDPEMLAIAGKRLKKYIEKGQCILVNDNFVNIERVARKNNWEAVDGILFDLGVTNLNL